LVPAAIDDASPEDIVSILVRTFIDAGAAPNVDWPFSICPGDHLVRVLLSLVDAGPAIVHVADESRSSREVIAWLVLAGYEVQLVSWNDWLARIESRGLHTRAPLRGLWALLRSEALLSYTRPRRSVVRIQDEFRVTEPLDPAFIDERLRAWQNTAWLPKPQRKGVHATAASRALPNAPKHVYVNGHRHKVLHAHVEPVLSGGGILSRLAAGFCNRPVGVFPAMLTLDNGVVLDVVLKASARGDELRALCTTVARVSSPELADTLDKHRHWLDVGAAESRERALYQFAGKSLSTFVPHCYSLGSDVDHDAPLVLERLRKGQQVEMLDAVDSPWSLDQVRRVVVSLARLHAVCRDHQNELRTISWARPLGTTATMLHPMWEALFVHARTQIDTDVASIAAPLLENLDWVNALSPIPQTLLHNDVNPRNLALRTDSTTGIVLYDWELSAIGPSTRDLAEWLCYSLSPTVNEAETFSLVRAHAEIAVPNIDDDVLRAAMGASLVWFFFDRLTTYTVVSPIYELPWLARVFATWRRLVKWFGPHRS
jgi:thiamine kinase-like enzyme